MAVDYARHGIELSVSSETDLATRFIPNSAVLFAMSRNAARLPSKS